jgi:hypothetical protein
MKVADLLFQVLTNEQKPSGDLSQDGKDLSVQGTHKSIKYFALYFMSVFHLEMSYSSLIGRFPGNEGGGVPTSIGVHIFM